MNGIPKIDFSRNNITFGVSKSSVSQKSLQEAEEGLGVLRKYLAETNGYIIECEKKIAETYPLNPQVRKLHDAFDILKKQKERIIKQINRANRTKTFSPQYINSLIETTSRRLKQLNVGL